MEVPKEIEDKLHEVKNLIQKNIGDHGKINIDKSSRLSKRL